MRNDAKRAASVAIRNRTVWCAGAVRQIVIGLGAAFAMSNAVAAGHAHTGITSNQTGLPRNAAASIRTSCSSLSHALRASLAPGGAQIGSAVSNRAMSRFANANS